MPTIYNGFKPGESRSKAYRAKKAGNGHSIVKTTTTRRGHDFSFTWSITCECGSVYTSRYDMERAFRSHEQHVKGARR